MKNAFPVPPEVYRQGAMQRALGFGEEWGFLLACFKDHSAEADDAIGVQTYATLAVNWVLAGRSTYIDAEGRRYPLGPGTLFQRLPGRPHQTLIEPGSGYREFYLVFDVGTSEAIRRLRLLDPRPVIEIGPNRLLLEQCLALHRSLADRNANRARLTLDALNLLQHAYELGRLGGVEAVWHTKIDQACARLDAEESYDLPLEDLARELKVAYPTFRRMFQRVKGLSPGEYRIRRRIERACVLLRAHSVAETATLLGYADAFTFSAQFKRLTGTSPRAYRGLRGGG